MRFRLSPSQQPRVLGLVVVMYLLLFNLCFGDPPIESIAIVNRRIEPFNAVRVRIEAVNPGHSAFDFNGMVPLECLTTVTPPFGGTLKGSAILLRDNREGSRDISFGGMERSSIRELPPKSCVSLSFAIAATWSRFGAECPPSAFLFPRSGNYELHWKVNRDFEQHLEKVRVARTTGALAELIDRYLDKRALLEEIISPILVPDVSHRAELEALIAKFPNSTYADYAKFALARSYMKSVDPRHAIQPERRVTFWQGLLHGFEDDSAASLTETLASTVFGTKRSCGQRKAAIDAVIAARNGTALEQQDAIKAMIRLATMTEDDKLAAISWLQKIEDRNFAYYPESRILLYRIFRADQNLRAQAVKAELDRDFYDAYAWLEEIAPTMTLEEWRDYRIRPIKAE